MELTREHPIRRFRKGQVESLEDPVVVEARIELDLNDGQWGIAMLCLPRDLDALGVGFLLGEGILRSADDLESVEVDESGRKVLLRGDFDADVLDRLLRRWTWGTGCGGGGTGRDFDLPVYKSASPGSTVRPEALIRLSKGFQGRCVLWGETGGVHACALTDPDRVLLFAEDVGRHNAFDKVIGRALMEGIPLEDKLALTTGRLSGEIVLKAVACGVPILVSRSGVTSLAVDLARKFGLTLVGFLRAERMNVYTGYQRVVGESSPGEEGCS